MIKWGLQLLERDKRVRFLLSGGLAFIINMLIAALFFQMTWTQESFLQKNIANVIITELSMICAFFLHNSITWRAAKEKTFSQRFIHFHYASGIGLALRFGSFAAMTYFNMHVYIATVISVVLASVINYLCYDRIVFRAVQHD